MAVEFISCIGVALMYYALVELCKLLDRTPLGGVNRVQSPEREHGLSCSIVLLAVAMTESALNRAMYMSGYSRPKGRPKPREFFAQHIGDQHTGKDLEEVYVLRDAVFHNAMWTYDVPDLSNLDDPRIVLTRLPGYRDRKFERCVDSATEKTKRLGLNVVPSKVTREDAWTVLDVASRVCAALEQKNDRYFPLSTSRFAWPGSRDLTFSELTKLLGKTWRTSRGKS